MARPRLILLLAVAAGLLLVPLARPAARVIGGSAVQVQSAPWTVFIRQSISGNRFFQCSGSIVDPLHVVTAAHCVFDQTGNQASITSLTVRAGISNFTTPAADDAEQDRSVSSLRIHPGWASANGDDVAVLALNAPLDFSGGAVQAVALPRPAQSFPPRTAVGLAGFGAQIASRSPSGALVWYTATTDEPDNCGGFSNEIIPNDDAVAICASSPSESVCNGDSGAGLVTTGGTPTLIGIASSTRPGCDLGSSGVFTSVVAPEILRFIQGDDTPPVAPRATASTTLQEGWHGPLVVGNTLTCDSSGWGGAPTLSYSFVDSRSETVLQQGPRASYRLTPKAVGATIYCRVLATNDGGTAALRTTETHPIAPPPHVGITTRAPRAVARGRTVTVKVVVHAGVGLSGKFGVCITPPARIARRVCSSQVIDDGSYGGFPFTLGVRIKPTAPVGVASLAIEAVAGLSRARSRTTVRIT